MNRKAYLAAKKKFTEINKKSLSANHLLDLYQSEIQLEKDYIKSLSFDIDSLKSEQQQLDAQLKQLSADLESYKKSYKDLIFYAYKTRRERQTASYFWAAEDMASAYKRFVYVRFMTDYIAHATDALKEKSDSVIALQKENENILREKIRLADLRADRMIELDKKIGKQQAYIRSLSKQKNKLRADLQRKEKKAKQLNNAVNKTVTKQNSKPKSKATLAFEALKKKLPPPVNGVITSSFGEHRHNVLENVKTKNDGVDFTVSSGKAVKAVADGTVTQIISIPGANQAVLIKHGDYYTVYSNLVNVQVSQNQKIKQGDILGNVFYQKGSPDSGVLNFQLWNRNIKQNPMHWLR